MRYSCTYGPRQSIFNPYTGVIAIFCTRLLNNLPPILYEDGEQTRDFSFVEDIARANLLAAETDKLDGLAVNVGCGRGIPIREIAERVSDALKIDIEPEARGEFRPGEMRHLTSDATRIALPVTSRMSILQPEFSATSIGFERNSTFVIISAKRSRFCGAKALSIM